MPPQLLVHRSLGSTIARERTPAREKKRGGKGKRHFSGDHAEFKRGKAFRLWNRERTFSLDFCEQKATFTLRSTGDIPKTKN